MAFDQNAVPNNLRPIRILAATTEEPRIAPPVVTLASNPPGSISGSVPIYYPPEPSFVGVSYGNAVPTAVANWLPRVPAPVIGGAALPVTLSSPAAYCYNQGLVPVSRVDPNFGARTGAGSNASDQASEEGGDDSASGRKVKFLCSFGGKILPRPSDGALRYVGGHTRIISVRRDMRFNELVQKMTDMYGQNVVIKYQLPDEDLDALVSVSGSDDLDNMMDEYEKLLERSSDGSAKLRVFLFSASDLDSSGVVRFADLHDSGQRYVEAVNGIIDGAVTGGILRKESVASATSTQNSEVSGAEAVDSVGQDQGDVTGPPTGCLSPQANGAISQEPVRRLAPVEPNPTVDFEASAAPFSIPVIKSVTPPALSIQPDLELERSVPLPVPVQQQPLLGYNLQQPGVTFPPPASYMQAYIDPHHETLNRAEYHQISSQMGFPAQIMGAAVGPVLSQPQFHDNSVGASPYQFNPAVHMTMNPSTHHSFRPNPVPPHVHQQQQQVRMEYYPDESTFGQRVVQIPSDQSYTYQAQVPPSVAGGAYGWIQAHPEQVAFSEARIPHLQQVISPENIPRFDGCYMCQKALPHAHSDTIAQERKESPIAAASDLNSVYHSLRLDDITRGMQLNRAPITPANASAEGAVGKGAGVRPRVLGNMEHEGGKPQFEGVVGPSQNMEGQYTNDRTIIQKPENPEHHKVTVPQGVVGYAGGLQPSYGVIYNNNNIPQLSQESAFQQHVVPTQVRGQQDASVNKPVNSDHSAHESPREYSAKLPGLVLKEDPVESCFTFDNVSQIDGKMEDLRIRALEVLHNEQKADNSPKEEKLENRAPQMYLDNTVSQPQMVANVNYLKQNEMVPSSSEAPHLHGLQPPESYGMTQQSIFLTPDYPQASLTMNRTADNDVPHLNSDGLSRLNPSAQVTEGIPPIGEWKEYQPQFEPKMVPGDTGALPIDSLSPFNRVGEAQDSSNSLFSNQDPWNFRHDSHFPPPRPNKILIKKETFCTRDPNGESRLANVGESPTINSGGHLTETLLDNGVYSPSSNLDMEFNLEHGRSSKGSAEEIIKQELQAVAEGVTASVLQSSMPSDPDLTRHGRSEHTSEVNQSGEAHYSDPRDQRHDNFEDSKAKLQEKTNVGFTASDGLGRLQIIKNTDLEELRELGSGTFGTVYHGKWRGTDVAIKRINDRCFAGKPSEQEKMRDDFWNEAINLADLHHPNVVAFYGVVLDGPGGSVATVTEYMVNGSLRTALQKNERILDKRKRLLIGMDVAFGMEYLHGKNIVHFDLKSDNLLVNLRDPHRPICKVGDLGLSKVKCQTLISGGVRGTLPWMAPELLNGSSSLVSEKVDVFSFGIVMWELITGDEPYADLHYGAIIGGIVSNTLRPPLPESCDPEWKSLMERCWSAEPSERPSFTEIANQLRSMAAKVPPKMQQQQ